MFISEGGWGSKNSYLGKSPICSPHQQNMCSIPPSKYMCIPNPNCSPNQESMCGVPSSQYMFSPPKLFPQSRKYVRCPPSQFMFFVWCPTQMKFLCKQSWESVKCRLANSIVSLAQLVSPSVALSLLYVSNHPVISFLSLIWNISWASLSKWCL